MELNFFVAVILAGILASYGLLAMALWAHRLGLPRLDFSRAMANLTYGESFDGDPPYWSGQFTIYFNGVFFALLYATVFAQYIAQYVPWPDPIKGAIYGVGLWFVSGVFFVPVILREGLFLSGIHRNAWISSLMVHGIYGLIVGWLSPVL